MSAVKLLRTVAETRRFLSAHWRKVSYRNYKSITDSKSQQFNGWSGGNLWMNEFDGTKAVQ